MWSVKDMFYGEAEPVWIMKPEKEDNKRAENKGDWGGSTAGSGKKGVARAADESILSSIPYYPYYYPDYAPPPPVPRKVESKAAIVDQKKDFSVPYDPYYYTDYVPPPPAPKSVQSKAATATEMKDTKVVLKVPICCGECVESIEAAVYRIKGVKSVECDTRKERVTVIGTPAVAPADILSECRKVFKKSKFWINDAY